jgi:Tfp pilus assembly protein PilN
MIQFNLLPDVKLEFIKAQRTKRLVIGISILASVAALFILVILILTVDVVQKKTLSNLDSNITTSNNKLQSTPDLNQLLTIQNQLSAIGTLHDAKPAAARLFTYLSQVTPSQATIGAIAVDYTQNSITITGNADSLSTINTFVDTLKFTTYTSSATTGATKAFSNVVLTSFGSNAGSATYGLSLNFDPNIFSNTATVTLTVPNTVTTRSVTDQPTNLFKKSTTTTTTGTK